MDEAQNWDKAVWRISQCWPKLQNKPKLTFKIKYRIYLTKSNITTKYDQETQLPKRIWAHVIKTVSYNCKFTQTKLCLWQRRLGAPKMCTKEERNSSWNIKGHLNFSRARRNSKLIGYLRLWNQIIMDHLTSLTSLRVQFLNLNDQARKRMI